MPPPAYYLGRPARVYISAMTPQSRRLKSDVKTAHDREISSTMKHVRISDALRALVLEPDSDEELDQVLYRYYAPGYTHRANGKILDRHEFAQMAERARSQVAEGSVTVLDELIDGSAYAERHVFHITPKNGAAQDREVAVFGTFAPDGRFQSLSEIGFDFDPAAR